MSEPESDPDALLFAQEQSRTEAVFASTARDIRQQCTDRRGGGHIRRHRSRAITAALPRSLVQATTPGYRIGQKFEKMGLRTSPIGELVFEDMVVPATAVLGGVGGGAGLFAHAMEWERTCLFASHVGTMERLLEKVVGYARTRRQSGHAISVSGSLPQDRRHEVKLEAAPPYL